MVLIPYQEVMGIPRILIQTKATNINPKTTYIIATHIRFQDQLSQFFWDLRQDNKCTVYTFDFNNDNGNQIKIFKEHQKTKDSTTTEQEMKFVFNPETSLFDYTWKDSDQIKKPDPGYNLVRMDFPELLVIYKEINTKDNDTIKAFVTFVQSNHGFKQNKVYWWDSIVELTISVLQPTKLVKNHFTRPFEMYLEWCKMAGESLYSSPFDVKVSDSAVKDVVKILMWIVLILVLLLLLLSTCGGHDLRMRIRGRNIVDTIRN